MRRKISANRRVKPAEWERKGAEGAAKSVGRTRRDAGYGDIVRIRTLDRKDFGKVYLF